MASEQKHPSDALYDKAAEIAEKHLAAALEEGAALDYLVSVMMVEAAVNSGTTNRVEWHTLTFATRY